MSNYFTKSSLPGLWNGILSFVSCGVISSELCAGSSVGFQAVADKSSKAVHQFDLGKVILSGKPSSKFSYKC